MFVWECPPAFLKDRVESLKTRGWKFNAELVACNAGSDVYRVTAYHWGVFSHGRTTTTAWPDAWIGAVVSAEERTPKKDEDADNDMKKVMKKLELAAYRSPIVAAFLQMAKHYDSYSLLDALCDCIVSLEDSNQKLQRQAIDRYWQEFPSEITIDGKKFTRKGDLP